MCQIDIFRLRFAKASFEILLIYIDNIFSIKVNFLLLFILIHSGNPAIDIRYNMEDWRPTLPPIESFKLRNILESIDDSHNTRQAPLEAILNTTKRYNQDLNNQLNDIIRLEQQEIVERMNRILTSYGNSTKLIASVNKEITGSSNPSNGGDLEISKKGVREDFKDVKISLSQTKTRMDRLVRKLKLIETTLPGKERLFTAKSPHEHHYHELHKFGMGDEIRMRTSVTSSTIAKVAKERTVSSGPYVSTGDFVNPVMLLSKKRRESSSIGGDVEVNPEVITMMTTMKGEKDEVIISELKKILDR